MNDCAELLAGDTAHKATIRAALEEARARTWWLVSGLDDEVLGQPAAPYLSPPVWDLGHIANFEEQWLVQRLSGAEEILAGSNDTYDALNHPRPERPALRLLDREGARRYMDDVQRAAFEILASLDLRDGQRLVRDGFVHWMLVLHEHQHQETLLQSIAMRAAEGRYQIPGPVRRLPQPVERDGTAWFRVPAGRFAMGTAPGPGVYDNEAPVHEVHVADFDMARDPVTCGEFLRFMEAGGYEERRLWSERGRAWLDERPRHAPLYWKHDGRQWVRHAIGCQVPVTDWPDVILCHVTFFEAEAYAKWAGARLPTEAEWEKAARWDPTTGTVAGRNPWGDGPATTERANVDQSAFAPSQVGAFPSGASSVGCQHMIGDVWEWCSDSFAPYPGFEAFPYDAYSKVFFGGDHRMLRGGSWASRAGCANGTFRNWDHPYRRQIFSGIRLARDA